MIRAGWETCGETLGRMSCGAPKPNWASSMVSSYRIYPASDCWAVTPRREPYSRRLLNGRCRCLPNSRT